nr:MAG: nonstructural protein 1 [Hedgehog bocavirus]UMO75512.1 MAG: nonstructural protein 1 [Hedgehog bocavirus]
MAALDLSSTEIDLLGAISGCHDPAFTYVLRFPWLDWHNSEKDLQDLLCSHNPRGLDDVQVWQRHPGPDDPENQRAFLERHGPLMYYGFQLAKAAHNAAVRVFQQRQCQGQPTCTVYAQAELGRRDLHVHVVMGGPGLTKYNAKPSVKPLLVYWLRDLIDSADRRATSLSLKPLGDTARGILAHLKTTLQNLLDGGQAEHCTVLQYKSRTGHLHSCRINGPEYIANYLLPKNFKPHNSAVPEQCTLTTDFWPLVDKTYACSLVNGSVIPLGSRRRIFEQLLKTITSHTNEPSFGGELFEDLPKVNQASWSQVASTSRSMTKREGLMLDCMKRCTDNHLLTYEALVNHCPELVVMLEALPGGNRLIEQVLSMVHIKIVKEHTPLTYISTLSSNKTLTLTNKAFELLNYQGYNSWQLGHWLCVLLHRKAGKQNTLNFYGPASTGKTNLAKAIVNAVKLYGCVNHQNKSFLFNDCTHKLIVWWEECLMHTDWVEAAKCILGGTEFRIDRKHKDSMLLPTTPVIVSTNNNIYETVGGNTVNLVHSKPLRERVVQLNFMKQLSSTFGEISSDDIYSWLNLCKSRFEISLEGFLKQWNLQKLNNDFPLQELCPTCSQDLIVHDNAGPCGSCGGYFPLDVHDRGDPLPRSPEKSAENSLAGEFLTDQGFPTPSSWSGSEFCVSLLDTPQQPEEPKKRACKRKNLSSSSPSKEPKSRKQLEEEFTKAIAFIEEDEPQPGNYEQSQWSYSQLQEEQEPESITEMDEDAGPSRWGEMLGLVNQGPGETPIVLHCFETLENSEEEK